MMAGAEPRTEAADSTVSMSLPMGVVLVAQPGRTDVTDVTALRDPAPGPPTPMVAAHQSCQALPPASGQLWPTPTQVSTAEPPRPAPTRLAAAARSSSRVELVVLGVSRT